MPTKQDINFAAGDILIVDDEIANLKLLTQLLEQNGYQVRPAERPQLAIDAALAQPPALMLLDVRMPDMDGFEVCKRLKQDKRTRDIPVIYISALQDVQDKVRGFEAGGVDFITKPFQEAEVLARVRTHMELRNMQLNLEEMVARRSAELAQSESKYRGLVENALIGVFNSTLDGRFTFVNEAMARMFDFDSPEQMMAQRSLERWKDQKDRNRMLDELQKHGRVTNFEAETITHAARHIHVLFSARQIGNDILGMVMDITGRKQAEQKILNYQQRLKTLAAKLTIAEEKERRAIAADLHDRVCQSLVLANMQLDSARRTDSESGRVNMLDDIGDTLLEALKDTKLLMLELSSSSMHEIGLSSAISEWLESQIKKRYGLKTDFIDNFPGSHRKKLNLKARTILFRNVRELLVNVVKHARANKVSVRLEDRDPNLRIIVEDDGIGFEPPGSIHAGREIGGFGLFSIEELMADLGGSLKIVSKPGKGCTAILSAPFGDDRQEGG